MGITSTPLELPNMAGKGDFRQQAEKKAALSPDHNICLSLKETRQLIHELRVHQIELEMQNEELRRIQAELDAARHRYFDLYDRAPVGYITLDEANVIQDLNFTASTLLGDTRSELLGNSISKFISKDDQDAYYLFHKKLFKSAEPHSCEVRMVKGDGSTIWLHLTATIARNAAYEPVCRLALVDITARKRAEAELQAEKMNSETIFESSPIPLFVLDDKTYIVRVNAAAVVLFGGSAAAALHHRPGNALGCVHSSEDPRGCGYAPNCPLCPVRKAIEGLLKNGGEIHGVNLSLDLIRDGVPKTVWVEIGAKPIQIDGKRHVCVTMVDITERKRAEKVLEKQNNL